MIGYGIFRIILIVVHSAAWNFKNFSASQILHEINYKDCKMSKAVIFDNFKALNYDIGEFLQG